jgi:hypothetical protein
MQIKVFIGSKFWILEILLLPLFEIWDVTVLPIMYAGIVVLAFGARS